MIRLQLFKVAAVYLGIYIADMSDIVVRLKTAAKGYKNLSQNHGVVTGSVMIKISQTEIFSYSVQLAVFNIL